jgi:predicted Na+-dependent transporter
MLGIQILQLESIQPDFKSLFVSIVTTVVPLLVGVAINRFFGDKCGSGGDDGGDGDGSGGCDGGGDSDGGGSSSGERRIDKISSSMVIGAIIGFITINVSYLFNPYDKAFIASAAVNAWGCGATQNLCGLIIGYTVSQLAGLPTVYHRTLAFEVGAQNTLIAMTTATLAFSKEIRGVVISYILVYAITAFFINFGGAIIFRLGTPEPAFEVDADEGEASESGDTEHSIEPTRRDKRTVV